MLEERDFFITDALALLTMCRRPRDEHEIPVEAMSVGDYLASRK